MSTSETKDRMRLLRGALLLLAVGSPAEALAACCVTAAPVHVYVPPPTHVVVPHTTVVVPHTTYVRPAVLPVHPQNPTNTRPVHVTPSTAQTVHAKRHDRIVQTAVVTEPTPTKKRCAGKGQAADGCKPKDEETTWSKVKKWLQN